MEFQINETTDADLKPVWTITGYSSDGANGWGLGINLPSEAAAYRLVDAIRAEIEERPMRYALVRADAATTDQIAAYLPACYSVLGRTAIQGTNTVSILIGGYDVAGWTLDDYVLPRLASGMYFGEEIA